MDVLKIYQYALQREVEGVNFFRQNAQRVGHAAAVEVFKKLAEEEEKHIVFIQGLINAVEKGGAAKTIAAGQAMEAEGFFSRRAEAELLDQQVIEAMVPDLAVLRTAYLIERDFAEFYRLSANRATDPNAKKALTMLAGWEEQHERLFKAMHDRVFEEYAGMPWGG